MPGVQERPFELQDRSEMRCRVSLDTTVDGVSYDRMTDGAEVDAYLVGAAGRDRDLEKRDAVERLRRDDACDCFARPPRPRRNLLSIHRISTDWQVDSPTSMHSAPHECNVVLLDQAVAELPRKVYVREVVLGDHHESGRAAVETVYDAGPSFTANAAKILYMVQERVDERAICVARRWMYNHPWWFVDDDDVVVVVDDRDWKSLGLRSGWRGWRNLKGDQSVFMHDRAGVGGTRVDACHPLLDQTLDLRARTIAKVRGQHVIETLAGVFRRDPKAYDF